MINLKKLLCPLICLLVVAGVFSYLDFVKSNRVNKQIEENRKETEKHKRSSEKFQWLYENALKDNDSLLNQNKLITERQKERETIYVSKKDFNRHATIPELDSLRKLYLSDIQP